jgi:hypothetical protein
MPGPRLPMRKIRDVLRLSAAGMSKRKIAASLGVSATAAGDCIRRARRAGLGWPLAEDLKDETLELRLYPPAPAAKDSRPQPNWAAVHRELRARLSPTMRQNHVAGERMFVDYAGTTLEVIDASTGEAMTAQLFVRRARRVELHLCRGHVDAGPVRLDRLAHAHLCVHGWYRGDGGVRQSAVRHHQDLLLRAGDQPHLCRDGSPLRHRHCAGAAISGA